MKSQDEIELFISLFWEFSCDFYRHKAAFEELHLLQDTHHVNINRILLALFLTKSDILLGVKVEEVSGIERIRLLEKWIEKVRVLRNLIKEHPSNQIRRTRENVLSIELKLEKHHQRLLILSLSRHFCLGAESIHPRSLPVLFESNSEMLFQISKSSKASLQRLLNLL